MASGLTETATKLAAAVHRAEQLQQLGWCRACGRACPALSNLHHWCKAEELRAESRALDRPDDWISFERDADGLDVLP